MYDIIVVGGGPAGLTAALYASRAGKKVLVLEGETPGGQINYSPHVDNYPGLPGMDGQTFAKTLTQQALEQGVELVNEPAVAFRIQGDQMEIKTDEERYTSASVILATGVTQRRLGLEGEDELIGMGVSYCAVCDGAFYQDMPVAVVGGGDTALQEALFLSERCSKVTVIHRRDLFRGEAKLLDQLRARPNVEFLLSHTVKALKQDENGLTGLVLRDLHANEDRELAVDGLVVAVGQEPRNKIFASFLSTDERGYLMAGEDCATSLSGVFAAGDCRTKDVRQLTTAVGDGAVAALAACEYVDDWRVRE